jgi:sec-independent protein translocase protein TatA
LCDNYFCECAAARAGRAEDSIMGDFLQPTHLLIIAIILLVFFGGRKLPELGKGLGEGLKSFKEGLKGVSDSPAPPPAQPTTFSAPPVSSAANLDYVICTRCGSRVENPMGFKVVDYVCRSCQGRS